MNLILVFIQRKRYNYADLDNVSAAYDELYAIGMMQVCESAYRLEALAYTGMCAEHDGNSRSKTDSDMVWSVCE